eukprot:TRINITY_DN2636_c0_g1_i1.p1 TRINITY_DN2636_c0_g1~~TRINITY_DN2636_c0_g1_i1.p1  ORF type:complete len:128 (-),score=10.03 TRINITY_DN2636_c0_g1_i1:34-417(-)
MNSIFQTVCGWASRISANVPIYPLIQSSRNMAQYKMKTRKAAKKRFFPTGSGKVKFYPSGKSGRSKLVKDPRYVLNHFKRILPLWYNVVGQHPRQKLAKSIAQKDGPVKPICRWRERKLKLQNASAR